MQIGVIFSEKFCSFYPLETIPLKTDASKEKIVDCLAQNYQAAQMVFRLEILLSLQVLSPAWFCPILE